jgi:mannosyl-oligosaccharide alpha-1,2-mannosidase
MSNGMTSHKFEHLSCFLPGLLALGVYTLPELSPRDKELHMWAARGLAYTCYITYADHATGLGPDEIMMHRWSPSPEKGRWLTQLEEWEAQESPSGPPPGLEEVPANATDRDYYPFRDSYLLRPEVCVFILGLSFIVLTQARLSKACTYCGGSLGKKYGGIEDGRTFISPLVAVGT